MYWLALVNFIKCGLISRLLVFRLVQLLLTWDGDSVSPRIIVSGVKRTLPFAAFEYVSPKKVVLSSALQYKMDNG